MNNRRLTISQVVVLIQQTGLYLTISEAVKVCLACEGLKTRQKYVSWRREEGNKKLFKIVKKMAKRNWENIYHPESNTIAFYQVHLKGYKNFKKCVNKDQVMNILNRLKAN